jgi:signal transduction histidine kinase/ligand-binding sensor domain-containing protein
MQTLKLILLLVIISFQCQSLFGQTPRSPNQQVIYQLWTFKDGAPESVYALEQTTDGFLWLGGPNGLFRFDGARFERFKSPFGDQLLATYVVGLYAPKSGGLWIGYLFGGFSFLNHGRVENYVAEAASTGAVYEFAQDQDGSVWACTTTGMWRLENSVWQHLGSEWNIPAKTVVSIGFDRDGILWVLGVEELFYLRPGRKQFQIVAKHPASVGFMFDADKKVVTIPAGNQAPNPSANPDDRLLAFPIVIISGKSYCQLTDPTNNVWTPLQDAWTRLPPSLQRYQTADKLLTSATIAATKMIDREGNTWYGGTHGLHRFFDSPLMTMHIPKAEMDYSIVGDEQGGVWIGSQSLRRLSTFDHVSNGKIDKSKVLRGIVSFLFRASDKTLWVATDEGLWRVASDEIVRMELPQEMADQPRFLQAITQDRLGGLWVSFGRHGLYRFADGVWTPYGGRQDLPKTGVIIEFTDRLGRVWFGYPKNVLAFLDGDRVQVLGPSDGLRVGNVTAIYGRGSGIWIGGEFGLQQFDSGELRNITAVNDELLRGISGIVETTDGDLWLNGLSGVVHIRRAEIEEALKDPAYRIKGERFGRRAGLPGTPNQIRPLPTAIEDSDGKIWFTSLNGVAWLDPTLSQEKVQPPPITIQSISADDKNYEIDFPLTFPAHTASVEINYTAVSLSDPEAIHFRYKLQETDKDWHESNTASPVTYRNLSPGSYHFIVAASDRNGVWSDKVANVDFTILPAFYQTRWFLLLCIAFALFVVWIIYNLRVRQIARAISVRFDERLAERTRIARELHDTLLQTVQGSKLVADDALEKSNDSVHMHHAMKRLSGWLGQATQEGRAALNSLRTSTIETNDLAAGLRRATEECVLNKSMAVKFSVAGGSRDMHPIARDEIYRIGYEAIRNACEHASASQLKIELSYAQDLTLRVNDNGIGIEMAVITEGKADHFGLQGMRERAERIGSKLTLVSSPNSGTELTLVVPGKVIFRKASATRLGRIKTFLGQRDGHSDQD